MKLLLPGVLLALALLRPYFPVTIAQMAAGKNFHTHVRVTGTVTEVASEPDGDTHIRLSDGQAFIVAECIPELPCRRPVLGQMVTVEGISRFDGEHKWYEVHPVEKLTIVNRAGSIAPSALQAATGRLPRINQHPEWDLHEDLRRIVWKT
jgi:hypothetical protein